MNILVGKNNSGKSTIVAALATLQQSASPLTDLDIRFGLKVGRVEIGIDEVEPHRWRSAQSPATYLYEFTANSRRVRIQHAGGTSDVNQLPPDIRRGFVHPFLSRRVPDRWEHAVDLLHAEALLPDMRNLPARFDALSDPYHEDHRKLWQLIESVIGLRISSVPHEEGKAVGLRLSSKRVVELSSLGSGIGQMLGMLVALSSASGMLFLIEEPENDLHPEALRALLTAIEDAATRNQFVISTHSNVVLRHLGALQSARIYEVSQGDIDGVPTSRVELVSADPESRRGVLSRLGYELRDFDVKDSWIVFEESSSERIVREFLIPWFVPGLLNCGTIASNGTGDVPRTFESVEKVVVFLHLGGSWLNRVQVLVDGDESGRDAVSRLRETFPKWPAGAFAALSQVSFEQYYPSRFEEAVESALRLHGREKREAKKRLLLDVVRWAHSEPEVARADFEESAREVIHHLARFEARIRGSES